ncbi:MAG: hypothetical protein QOJ66_3369 [Ilumatobacteraceae bacterium]
MRRVCHSQEFLADGLVSETDGERPVKPTVRRGAAGHGAGDTAENENRSQRDPASNPFQEPPTPLAVAKFQARIMP